MTKLAIFFLDALRFQDLNAENTPFLASISREGVSGPLETLLAYEGLAATLFSGAYPSIHGIWTRYYSDPARSPFRWITPFARILKALDGSSSLISKAVRYEVMRLSELLAGQSYFPGIDEVPFRQLARMNFSLKRNLYEPGCFGIVPSLFDIFRKERVTFRYFDHHVLDSDSSVFRRALSAHVDEDVVVVRLVDLDTESHRFGLESLERIQALRRTDSYVEGIVTKWRRESPRLAVMCFADHGMVPVKHYLDVAGHLEAQGLQPFHDLNMFLDSTMARFWGEGEVLERVGTALAKLPVGKILSDSDKRLLHIPPSPSVGQVIFLLPPGYAIFPSFFETERQIRAMHGYDPRTPGLETIFVLQSPEAGAVPRKLARPRMVDIVPTTLELLGLRTPQYCEGSSLLGS